ncbi:Metallo-dependent phosphatase-like protein [Aspergillus unguis]
MHSDEVQFVHFNDVYHIPSAELLARFTNLQREFAASNPNAQTLTLFSGDAFSPSLEASVLKGEHICPILDLVGIDIACYGNHDFDFGDARLVELSGMLKFPWLLSNAFHLGETRALGSAEKYTIRQLDNGLKTGFIGLAGTDWPSNCRHLPPCEFQPPVEAACRLARHLRTNEGCHLVIALTHMRVPEDMAVANATVSGDCRIDLLLGGHDHEVLRRFAGDTDLSSLNVEQGRKLADIEANGEVSDAEGDIRIVKSGTDWRAMSLVRLIVQRDENGNVVGSTVELRQYSDMQAVIAAPQPPANVVKILDDIHDRVGKVVQAPLLHAAVPIDGRNSTIRSRETNMGNMLADAIRAFYDTDIGFFNSGGIRSDTILKPTLPNGEPLLKRDIINICPFANGLVVKRVTGEVVRLALENSISDMHTDGRFLQISGLHMTANWQLPEWSRIVDVLIERHDGLEPLDPASAYTVALPAFIAAGFDGFSWFPEMETVVGEEVGMTDAGLLLAILDREAEEDAGAHVSGIERARAVTVVGYHPSDSLPIVRPVVDGRIRFAE